MRWARPYRKPPNHLTDREYRLRKRVFWTLYFVIGTPFYASLGLCMMALAPIIMAIGLLPHVIGTWSHQTFETKVLLIGAATYLVGGFSVIEFIKAFYLKDKEF